MSKKIISFDFDGCLTRSSVQEFAKLCLLEGHTVIVTTARWCSPLAHMWHQLPSNDDLYEIMDNVGIPRENVIFTNTHTKASLLIEAKVDFHLDDNADQIFWCNQLGVKNVDVTRLSWPLLAEILLKSPKYNIKLLIVGEGRHGKDTLADLLEEKCGLTTTSSSRVAAELFFNEYKTVFNYSSVEECYEDRVNKRKLWYDFITNYNSPDRTKLTRKILETSNIYVGLRNPEELEASRDLFDAVIYVDASNRLPGEGIESNGITRDMADFVIENNEGLPELEKKVEALAKILKLERSALK